MQTLLACAILARPQILIFDGIIHTMQPAMRETLLWWRCSKDEPWPVAPLTRYSVRNSSLLGHLSRITLITPSSESLKELRTFLSSEWFPPSWN